MNDQVLLLIIINVRTLLNVVDVCTTASLQKNSIPFWKYDTLLRSVPLVTDDLAPHGVTILIVGLVVTLHLLRLMNSEPALPWRVFCLVQVHELARS